MFFLFLARRCGGGEGQRVWLGRCVYVYVPTNMYMCSSFSSLLGPLRRRPGPRERGSAIGEKVSVLTCFVLLLVPCAVAAGILWLAVLVLLLAEHVVEELELRGGWEDQQEEYGQQVLCDEVHDVLFSFFLSYSFYVYVQGLWDTVGVEGPFFFGGAALG